MSVFFTIRQRRPRFTKPAARAVCTGAAQRQSCLAKLRIIPWGPPPRSPHFWLNPLTTFCEARSILGGQLGRLPCECSFALPATAAFGGMPSETRSLSRHRQRPTQRPFGKD